MDKIVIYDTETTNSTIWGSIIEVGAVVVDKNLKEIGNWLNNENFIFRFRKIFFKIFCPKICIKLPFLAIKNFQIFSHFSQKYALNCYFLR